MQISLGGVGQGGHRAKEWKKFYKQKEIDVHCALYLDIPGNGTVTTQSLHLRQQRPFVTGLM